MNIKLKTFLLSLLMFANAFLIFAIQPIFAKDLLPLFGGSAAVWNVSCFFFQLLLLGGYVYAHKIHNHLRIHAVALLAAMFFLPFGLRVINAIDPTLSVILILLSSVGFVYFLLSSTAPLVQKISGLQNPYILYSSSNLGALSALLAFPILIEPLMTRGAQKDLMSVVAGLVIVSLVALCLMNKNNLTQAATKIEKTPWTKSLQWILLAFIPSSLMLGVTEYISHEMFVIPLFWVIPLALYFLSFVFAFRSGARKIWETPLIASIPFLFATMVVIDFLGAEGTRGFIIMAVHLTVFFYIALLFHGKLAKGAPNANNLTWFYVCLSIGGAIGGFFNSIVAPLIFNSYLEYPIILILTLTLLGATKLRKLFFIVVAVICGLLQLFRGQFLYVDGKITNYRNFYGVATVVDNPAYTLLMTTKIAMHGIQYKNNPKDPAVYYYQNSPSDLFMNRFSERLRGKNIALVGLGGGSLLCYATAGQNWDVFDINPYMFKLSGKSGTAFSYFDSCTPDAREIIGDGRLEMARQPNGKYDLIIIDVFHGFSLPTHLLTIESFKVYLDKLSPNGVLLFHINTMGMNLMPVIAAHLRQTKTYAKYKRLHGSKDTGMIQTWLAVSRQPLDLLRDWDDVPPENELLWTDDFAPIFPVLIWGK